MKKSKDTSKGAPEPGIAPGEAAAQTKADEDDLLFPAHSEPPPAPGGAEGTWWREEAFSPVNTPQTEQEESEAPKPSPWADLTDVLAPGPRAASAPAETSIEALQRELAAEREARKTLWKRLDSLAAEPRRGPSDAEFGTRIAAMEELAGKIQSERETQRTLTGFLVSAAVADEQVAERLRATADGFIHRMRVEREEIHARLEGIDRLEASLRSERDARNLQTERLAEEASASKELTMAELARRDVEWTEVRGQLDAVREGSAGRTALEALSGEVKSEREARDALAARIEALAQTAAGRTALEALAGEVKSEREARDSLAARIDALAQTAAGRTALEALSGEVKSEREARDALAARIDALAQTAAGRTALEALAGEVKSEREARDALAARLDSVAQTASAQTSDALAQTDARRVELQKQVESMRSDVLGYLTAFQGIETDLQSERHARKALGSRLDAADAEAEKKLAKEFEQRDAAAADLTGRVGALLEQATGLGRRIETEQKARAVSQQELLDRLEGLKTLSAQLDLERGARTELAARLDQAASVAQSKVSEEFAARDSALAKSLGEVRSALAGTLAETISAAELKFADQLRAAQEETSGRLAGLGLDALKSGLVSERTAREALAHSISDRDAALSESVEKLRGEREEILARVARVDELAGAVESERKARETLAGRMETTAADMNAKVADEFARGNAVLAEFLEQLASVRQDTLARLERIDSLAGDIRTERGEREQLSNRVGAAVAAVEEKLTSELTGRDTAVADVLSRLREDLDETAGHIERISGIERGLESERKEREALADHLTTQIEARDSALQESIVPRLDALDRKIQEDLSRRDQALNNLLPRIDELGKSVHEASAGRESLAAELRTAIAAVEEKAQSEFSRRDSSLAESLNRLGKAQDELAPRIDGLAGGLQTERREREELAGRVGTVVAESAEKLTAELSNRDAAVSEVLSRLREDLDQTASEVPRIAHVEQGLDVERAEREELENRLATNVANELSRRDTAHEVIVRRVDQAAADAQAKLSDEFGRRDAALVESLRKLTEERDGIVTRLGAIEGLRADLATERELREADARRIDGAAAESRSVLSEELARRDEAIAQFPKQLLAAQEDVTRRLAALDVLAGDLRGEREAREALAGRLDAASAATNAKIEEEITKGNAALTEFLEGLTPFRADVLARLANADALANDLLAERHEREQLAAYVDKAVTASEEKLNNELASRDTAVADLLGRLRQEHNDTASQIARVEGFEQGLESERKEREALAVRIAAETGQSIARLRAAHDELGPRIDALGNAVQAERAGRDALAGEVRAAAAEAERKITGDLTRRESTLKASLAALGAQHDEVAPKIDALHQALRAESEDRSELAGRLQSALEAAEEKLGADAVSRAAVLESSLADLRAAHEALAARAARIESLEAEIQVAREEHEELSGHLGRVVSATEGNLKQELSRRDQSLGDSLARINAKHADLLARLSRIDELDTRLSAEQKGREGLAENLDAVAERALAEQERNEARGQRLETVEAAQKKEVGERERHAQTVSAGLVALRKEMLGRTAKIDVVEGELHKARQENLELTGSFEEWTAWVRSLRQEVFDRIGGLDKLVPELKAERDERTALSVHFSKVSAAAETKFTQELARRDASQGEALSKIRARLADELSKRDVTGQEAIGRLNAAQESIFSRLSRVDDLERELRSERDARESLAVQISTITSATEAKLGEQLAHRDASHAELQGRLQSLTEDILGRVARIDSIEKDLLADREAREAFAGQIGNTVAATESKVAEQLAFRDGALTESLGRLHAVRQEIIDRVGKIDTLESDLEKEKQAREALAGEVKSIAASAETIVEEHLARKLPAQGESVERLKLIREEILARVSRIDVLSNELQAERGARESLANYVGTVAANTENKLSQELARRDAAMTEHVSRMQAGWDEVLSRVQNVDTKPRLVETVRVEKHGPAKGDIPMGRFALARTRVPIPDEEQPSPERKALDRAEALAVKGRLAEAAAILEEALKQLPDSVPLCLALAQHHFELGNREAAEKHFKRAGKLNPNAWEARLGVMATARPSRMPQFAAALAAIATVGVVFALLRPQPVAPPAQPSGHSIESSRNQGAATTSLAEAVPVRAAPPPTPVVAPPAPIVQPPPATVPPVVAVVVPPPAPEPAPSRKTKPSKSKASEGNGAKGGPEKIVKKGEDALRSGKIDVALAAFSQAIKDNPNLPTAHRGMAMVLVMQGKEKDAKHEYETYLQLAPAASDANRIKQLLQDM